MNAKTFRELRAWQAAYALKLRIYDLIEQGPLSRAERLQGQLRESAASAPVKSARASVASTLWTLLGSSRWLERRSSSARIISRMLSIDTTSRSSVRAEHDKLAQEALVEIGGLLDYLHSPEAKRNAERFVRDARSAPTS